MDTGEEKANMVDWNAGCDASRLSGVGRAGQNPTAGTPHGAVLPRHTYRYRLTDASSRTPLCRRAGAVNDVWHDGKEVSLVAFRRDQALLTAYALHTRTAGTSTDLRLSAETMQHVCTA